MDTVAKMYEDPLPLSKYYDKRSRTLHLTVDFSAEQYEKKLRESTTLYVGNIAFYTRDFQLLALFSRCGKVRSLIMGVNRQKKVPCGFCFVEYTTREDAARAVEVLNRTTLDGRLIRVDWDIGFTEGRQYGRGKSGGQVRDEIKQELESEGKRRRRDSDDEKKSYKRSKNDKW
eukprot:TRINITY_DN12894_c0_g1_i1.p1 TRINITY_DN12894_c0_g1~~TRINITY_DN12894_c0_g1_i1.p1  ORF type:complete len:173 (-),score=57.08 TRINITY_DN12894_c0_g1_i1:110-628(-)